MIGVFIALTLVRKVQLKTAADSWAGEGIKNAAIILVITGAGGSFGAILKASPMANFINTNLAGLPLGILLPFFISAALKTTQGSLTVAIITTASIMAPLLAPLGLNPALAVLAIGAGSMVVSHANDSCFWVVSKFSNMPVATSYKAYTTATLLEGVVAIIFVAILSIFIH